MCFYHASFASVFLTNSQFWSQIKRKLTGTRTFVLFTSSHQLLVISHIFYQFSLAHLSPCKTAVEMFTRVSYSSAILSTSQFLIVLFALINFFTAFQNPSLFSSGFYSVLKGNKKMVDDNKKFCLKKRHHFSLWFRWSPAA